MSALRRVYRATAAYDPAPPFGAVEVITRHFLTKRARDRWAAARLAGYPEEPGDMFGDGRPPIPPATRVETADSCPIEWPS